MTLRARVAVSSITSSAPFFAKYTIRRLSDSHFTA